jgi:hypothetical protein
MLEKQNTAYVVPNAMLILSKDNKKVAVSRTLFRQLTHLFVVPRSSISSRR